MKPTKSGFCISLTQNYANLREPRVTCVQSLQTIKKAQTLLKRCSNAAQTLRKRCANAAQTLRKRCANAAHTLRLQCTLRKLSTKFTNSAQTLRKLCANNAQMSRKHCLNAAQTYCVTYATARQRRWNIQRWPCRGAPLVVSPAEGAARRSVTECRDRPAPQPLREQE